MEDEHLSPKARKRGSAGRYQEVRLVHPDGASARTLVNELLIGLEDNSLHFGLGLSNQETRTAKR
eukprot:8057001-Pyramimonas_sp.AAC.1